MTIDDRINIRPGVSILSVLRHLNYKPWYALAEFVDNSVQSYLSCSKELKAIEGESFVLRVSIFPDPSALRSRLIIRDNAAGIATRDYARAFRPAAIPDDRSGLSEFGMGMKSAACWFSPRWSVRTSALNEDVERTVSFDVKQIVNDNLEELTIEVQKSDPNTHYTEIILDDLYKPPQGRTIAKIKDHLASIYRVFIRDGILELEFDGEQLEYPQPPILVAPDFKNPEGESVEWRKEINFDFGEGLKASGFAALRETGSTSEAGFALFRRSRVIEGSADEGYRPEFIFKKSNSYTYQRLFGELHLEGFGVSHTKDGFRWEENEEAFLELLKEFLEEEPLPLISQAEGHRVRVRPEKAEAAAKIAVESTTETLKRNLTESYPNQFSAKPDPGPPPEALVEASTLSKRTIIVEIKGIQWEISIELSADRAVGSWVEISDQPSLDAKNIGIRKVGMRMSTVHPFMERFGALETDPSRLDALLRVGTAIILAEISAAESGVRGAGTIRRNINDLLRNALSKP